MTTIQFLCGVLISIVLAVLVNLPFYLRERRLRRLAKAKLEISKVVTKMEESMLRGQLTAGEECHDKIFKLVLKVQATENYPISWNLLRTPSKSEREFQSKLHAELISKDSEISSLIEKFVRMYFQAFRNRRPLVFVAYILWLLLFAKGMSLVLAGLKQYKNLRQGYKMLRTVGGEWLVTHSCDPT